LLFDPLPLDEQCPIHCQGHINPISFYFLAYIFSVCGYEKIKLHVDRRKKSGIFLTALFYLPLKLFYYLYCRKLKKKKPKIYKENKSFLNKINSFDLLTSRSVIIEGIK
jgi:hypothetical protein